jgi:hypothetical protein
VVEVVAVVSLLEVEVADWLVLGETKAALEV